MLKRETLELSPTVLPRTDPKGSDDNNDLKINPYFGEGKDLYFYFIRSQKVPLTRLSPTKQPGPSPPPLPTYPSTLVESTKTELSKTNKHPSDKDRSSKYNKLETKHPFSTSFILVLRFNYIHTHIPSSLIIFRLSLVRKSAHKQMYRSEFRLPNEQIHLISIIVLFINNTKQRSILYVLSTLIVYWCFTFI